MVTEPAESSPRCARAERGELAPWDLVTVNALRWRMEPAATPISATGSRSSSAPPTPALLDAPRHAAAADCSRCTPASSASTPSPPGTSCVGASWNWERSSHPPLGRRRRRRHRGRPRPSRHRRHRAVPRRTTRSYGFLDTVDDLVPLLTASHMAAGSHPLLWARPFGEGRVVTDLLGHGIESMTHPAHRAVLRRALPGHVEGPIRRARDSPEAKERPMTSNRDEITITTYEEARDAFRQKELRQALYDAGEVVMADVLVNLHGDEHRSRRRLENRLFRRDTQTRYERELFPPIVEDTLAPASRRRPGRAGQPQPPDDDEPGGVHRRGRPPERDARGDVPPLLVPDAVHRGRHARALHRRPRRQAGRGGRGLDAFDREFLQPSIATPAPRARAVRRGRDRRGRPPPRRAHRAAAQPGRPRAAARRRAARDVLLPPRRRPHLGHRVRAHAAQHLHARRHAARPTPSGPAPTSAFLQRCVHETIRLQPSSPVAMRWALDDVDLPGGVRLARRRQARRST